MKITDFKGTEHLTLGTPGTCIKDEMTGRVLIVAEKDNYESLETLKADIRLFAASRKLLVAAIQAYHKAENDSMGCLGTHEIEVLREAINTAIIDREPIAHAIYDILSNIGGAAGNERTNFVYHFVYNPVNEWRFQGKLGFGGKFRAETMKVDYYDEDRTKERDKICDEINTKLWNLKMSLYETLTS